MQIQVSMYVDQHGQTVCRTLQDETYYTSAGMFVVPQGFESDGASLPRLFWRLLGHPFSMDYLWEAVLHDYLYRTQTDSRKVADSIFFNLLKDKMPVRSRLIYWSLRLFGWIAWNSNRKKLKESKK